MSFSEDAPVYGNPTFSDSTTPDPTFPVLPPDPGTISPDLALDAILAPVGDDFLDDDEQQPYGKGWLFDFNTNQFVRNGTAPAEVYGQEQLVMWIVKTLNTAKYAHPLYSDDYGIEDPFAPIGFVADNRMLAEYQDAVVEALQAHDRIDAVDEFDFSQSPFDDALSVSFTVVLDTPVEGGDIEADTIAISQTIQTGA